MAGTAPGNTTQANTAQKSTAPKKSRSFHLFGRKKDKIAPPVPQQKSSVTPPSAGRRRRYAITPAQGREIPQILENLRKGEDEQRAERPQREQKILEKRKWFEEQMLLRKKEKEEEREQEKVEAKRAHRDMVLKSRVEDLNRLEGRAKELEDKAKDVGTELDNVKKASIAIKGTTHTSNAKKDMKSVEERMSAAEKEIESLSAEYTEVRVLGIGKYDNVIEGLKKKKEDTEKEKAAAEGRIARSTEARARLEAYAKDPKVMKLIRKIAGLNASATGNDVFQLLPQNQTPGNGNPPPTPPQPPTRREQAKAFFKRLWEFLTNHKEDLQGAADNINGVMAGIFDFAGSNKGGTGSSVLGAANSFFGAILNVIEGWKTFSKMRDEDTDRRSRPNADDKGLDGQTIWRRFREGLGKVVDTLSSIAGIGDGIVSVIGIDPVSSIIGIVTNSASLVMQCIKVLDNALRSRGVEERKKRIRQKMLYKQEKYGKNPDLSDVVPYFTLPAKARSKAVEEKRKDLRAKLAKDVEELKLQAGQTPQAIAKETEINTNTSGVKFKDTEVHYDKSYTTLSQKIMAEKKWKRTQSDLSYEKRKAYKKRILLMEALDLLNQYYLEDQERDRQRKGRRAGYAETVKAGVSVGANIMKLIGHLTAAFSGGMGEALTLAGGIVDVANNVGSLVQSGVQKAYAHASQRNGHNNDKALRRNELALTLFESVKDLTNGDSYGWDTSAGSFNNLDKVEDYRMKSGADRITSFAGMIEGVDLDIEAAMQTQNRDSMLKLLSASFSQSQEVE